MTSNGIFNLQVYRQKNVKKKMQKHQILIQLLSELKNLEKIF